MDGKKFPYVVILRNTTDKPFTILAILLNTASLVFFVRELFAADAGISLMRAVGIIVQAGLLVYNLVKLKKGLKTYFDRTYLVTALLWLAMPYMQWLIIPFIILALLEHQVKFPLEIGFSETQIVFNTLFRKKYKWNHLSNVMLKDGMLTIDFANNRLMQRPVEDDDDDDDASEEEFNEFCRQQLNKSRW